jgi:cytochrome b pre-mRNA-processing protein 3
MAIWPFLPSRANQDADRLLDAVTQASRRPVLFGAGRIPDTLEGRFEALALNGALAMIRIHADAGAAPLAQAFADRLFRAVDAGLREAGVGDTAVPKRMQKLASAYYGRLDAYAVAIRARDGAALAAALGRNVFADEARAFAPLLAEHMLEVARLQAQAPLNALFLPAGWPQFAT